jgi:hypothetical protein
MGVSQLTLIAMMNLQMPSESRSSSSICLTLDRSSMRSKKIELSEEVPNLGKT